METSYIKEYYNNVGDDVVVLLGGGELEPGEAQALGQLPDLLHRRPVPAGVASMALAMDGYHVRAIELVEHNIEVFRANLKECGAEIPSLISRARRSILFRFSRSPRRMV